MFRIKFPTKRIFQIFPILRTVAAAATAAAAAAAATTTTNTNIQHTVKMQKMCGVDTKHALR